MKSYSIQKRIARAVCSAFAVIAASAPVVAIASDYPTRPVRIVVGFTPGGTTDNVARLMAQSFSSILGQSVIVENKPGANGNIATEYVRRADPDGYTLFYTSIGHATNPSIYKEATYDPVKDFTPIGQVLSGPNVLVVPEESPFKTVQELVTYAKANPGKLTFASSGVGASVHLAGEVFKQDAGIDIVHVPYKGTGSLMPDLLAGRVSMAFPNLPSGAAMVKQGKLRALGVTSNERSTAYPDIPTIAESGVPGYDISTWYGLIAPANLPADIQKKLSAALIETVNKPQIKEYLIAQGMEPKPTSSEEFATFIASETKRWNEVLKDMKVN